MLQAASLPLQPQDLLEATLCLLGSIYSSMANSDWQWKSPYGEVRLRGAKEGPQAVQRAAHAMPFFLFPPAPPSTPDPWPKTSAWEDDAGLGEGGGGQGERPTPLCRLGKSSSINGVRVCSDKDLLLLTVSKNQ